MSGVANAMSGMGAALLPVATALLFEELTFGGLVRLLIAPRPGFRKNGAMQNGRARTEHKHPTDQRTVCGDPHGFEPEGSGGGR